MKYLSLYFLELKHALNFRANLYAWLLFQPFQLYIIYLLWSGIFQFTDSFIGMPLKEVLAYYFIVHFITLILSPTFSVNYLLWTDINEGLLDKYICRPINYLPALTFRSLAEPSIALIVGIPCFIASLYFIEFKVEILNVLAFCISLILAILLVIEFQKFIGIMTFWFKKMFTIRDIIFCIFMLFSGQLIPLAALPAELSWFSGLLPFDTIYHTPITLFTQEVMSHLPLILKQICWLMFLKILVHVSWRLGIKRYTSQGG